MRPALLLLVSLALLVGSCGEESSSEGSEAATENPTAPNQEVKPDEPITEDELAATVSVSPNLKYEIKGDAVIIIGCDREASGALTIPATIEGTTVTSIGKSAFSRCYSLTSIRIPDSVTSIGEGAFYKCTSLPSITIPDGVTSIGDTTFYRCNRLTSIKIPDSVTSIGEGAFYSCNRLTSITIPDRVTSIGMSAFLECANLTSITIPDSVTSIGDYAFLSCTGLTSITIPDSVTSIGERAFTGCSSLLKIEVGTGNISYADVSGVLFNKKKTLLITYPKGKKGTNYDVPDGVSTIGDTAFYESRNLRSITISDGATAIGNEAFHGCSNLTKITIPDSVTSIGAYAFVHCTSLSSIAIPSAVEVIRNGVFESCYSLTKLIFLGDAPKASEEIFIHAAPTIYRKPEAKGWGGTFAGRPVKLISEKP